LSTSNKYLDLCLMETQLKMRALDDVPNGSLDRETGPLFKAGIGDSTLLKESRNKYVGETTHNYNDTFVVDTQSTFAMKGLSDAAL